MFVFFRGAVGDKFVFMDDNATCHRTLAVQDCLDSGVFNVLVWASAFSRSRTPLKMCGMLWGGKLLVETILRQTRALLIRALTEEWDKLPQQLLDNVVQSMVRRCGMLHHTPRWTYPVLIPFFKVPADF
ncbi:hypothetical protein TNCV_3348461 [Trichonephila clavipes]|nr:hypothetical protein TNCV_3348461 [Trichonephila clavipes]